MAAETPFGLSFGNPSKYMGQSPLAEVGKAIKTGLIGYGIQKSGLESWLNEKGMKRNKQGGYEYNAPAGSVPPITSGSGGVNSDGVWGQNPMPISPSSLSQPVMPMIPEATSAVSPAMAPQPQIDLGPPPDVGDKILDDAWHAPVSDLSNKTDFNPVAQQTGYNQMLVTGNEYQQAPGYGKLQKTLQTMFGMG
jgi:hypothetical protein